MLFFSIFTVMTEFFMAKGHCQRCRQVQQSGSYQSAHDHNRHRTADLISRQIRLSGQREQFQTGDLRDYHDGQELFGRSYSMPNVSLSLDTRCSQCETSMIEWCTVMAVRERIFVFMVLLYLAGQTVAGAFSETGSRARSPRGWRGPGDLPCPNRLSGYD